MCQIVLHAFGDHSHCESWCGYLCNPETYRHKSLPPAASSKDVESFNNVIASIKAPKRFHCSGSGSLENRISCAVAEKNMGTQYVSNINTLVGVSTGTIFKKYAERKDNIRKRRLLYENKRLFKKQKFESKLKKNRTKLQCESREGVTYQTAVDLSESADVTEIPPPRPPIEFRKIELPVSYSSFFCDIETTSLSQK